MPNAIRKKKDGAPNRDEANVGAIGSHTAQPRPAVEVTDLSARGPVYRVRSERTKGLLLHEGADGNLSLVNLADGQGFILSFEAAEQVGKILLEWATSKQMFLAT